MRRLTIRRILCFSITVLIVACSRKPAADSAGVDPSHRQRAVLIGIDGADWRILEPLIEAGELPHLAGLRSRGVHGVLNTLRDIPLSPVVWTSIATGKGPAKHGITWFLVDQPDGTRTPVQSSNRRAEALWGIVDRAGLRSASVGWWATYPAEPLANGVMVSDALGVHGFGSTAREGRDGDKVHPPARFAELDAWMPVEQQIGADFAQRFLDISAEDYARERFDPAVDPYPHPFQPIHLFQQYAVTAQGYTRIAQELLEAEEFDLALLYYEQTDSFGHLFMKYEPPRLPWVDRQGIERYSRVVREWYRYQDELLGWVLESIDLESTAVFVVSDHGFKSGQRRIRSELVVDPQKAHLDHEPEGIFLAAGPGIRRGARLEPGSVLDVTPTLLHYLGLPVGKDMDGRVWLEAFDPTSLGRREVRYVATHEQATEPPRRYGAGGDPEAGLRALGYLGDEDSEQPSAVESPELLDNLARIQLNQGDLEQALETLQRALELDDGDAGVLLSIGQVHLRAGRSASALHAFERALAADPGAAGAVAQMAAIQRDRGSLDEAERLYREALAIDGSQPGLHVGLGDVLHRSGDSPAAVQAFRRALELDPDHFAAHYNLGVCFEAIGQRDAALKAYVRARSVGESGDELAPLLNNLGALRMELGQPVAALEAFEEAARHNPKHVESRFNAAMILRRKGERGEALARLWEAAALQPGHELVQLQLGLLLLEAGELSEASRALLLVRRRYPHQWRATLGLAAIERVGGRVDAARALRDEALAAGGEGARTELARFPGLDEL